MRICNRGWKYYGRLSKHSFMPRWSGLRRDIRNLFAPGIDLDCHAMAYRMRTSRAAKEIPRFWITLGKEIIWDFPQVQRPFRGGFSIYQEILRIYPILMREHIDSPIDECIAKMGLKHPTSFYWEGVWPFNASSVVDAKNEEQDFRQILVAADRRLGKRKIEEIFGLFDCAAARKIILARWPELAKAPPLRKTRQFDEQVTE